MCDILALAIGSRQPKLASASLCAQRGSRLCVWTRCPRVPVCRRLFLCRSLCLARRPLTVLPQLCRVTLCSPHAAAHTWVCWRGHTSDPQGASGPGRRVSQLLWLGALVPGLLTRRWAMLLSRQSGHKTNPRPACMQFALPAWFLQSREEHRASWLAQRHQESQGQLGRMGHMPGPRDVPPPAPQLPP